MAEFAESRRRLLATVWIASTSLFLGTGGVGVGLAAEKSKTRGEEKEVGAVEDLMREHGVLRRALLVYIESVPKLRANAGSLPADAIARTAKLFRSFGEDYHERMLEEPHIFPAVKKGGRRCGGVCRCAQGAARSRPRNHRLHPRGHRQGLDRDRRCRTPCPCLRELRADVPEPHGARGHDRLSGLEGCAVGAAASRNGRSVRGHRAPTIWEGRLRGCRQADRPDRTGARACRSRSIHRATAAEGMREIGSRVGGRYCYRHPTRGQKDCRLHAAIRI
jgi:hypothetical protein